MTIGDPTYVTPAQLRAAYDALGLDPELFSSTRSIRLDPHEVTVARYVLNDDGTWFIAPGTHEPVTWSTGLPVSDTDPNDMTAMLHAGLGDGQQLLALLCNDDGSDRCGDPNCRECEAAS